MASRVLGGSGGTFLCSGSLLTHQRPSAGPELQEMTSAPLSAAHLNASASRCDPRPEASRIGISFACGATPDAPFVPLAQATPAQAVPWFSGSSGLGSFGLGSFDCM